MKFLLVLIFCSSYLLVSCTVSKCYEASNMDWYPYNSTIENCKTPNNVFCGTATYKNGEIPWNTCGDEEICYFKHCYDTKYCTKPGTYEHDYRGLDNVTFTVTCCDTDLCNVESSAKTLYIPSLSCLFYISVFIYLYFVTL